MFFGFLSAICTAIASKLCTQLYIYDLQIMIEDGYYRPVFERVMLSERSQLCPLNLTILGDFTVFGTFFSLLTYIHLIFGALICHSKIQIKFEFDFDALAAREKINFDREYETMYPVKNPYN
jgi:hypothetical protein